MKLIFGLGNKGDEYKNTRHNVGAIVVSLVEKKIEGIKIKFLLPETFMNHSGKTLSRFVKSKKDISSLVVIYDDIDLPIGKIKISFNRSHGGHNGLKSVIQALKTEEFLRIRIGIAPITPTGKIKKPKGEKAVLNFLLGELKKQEMETIKKVSKKVAEAVEIIFNESREKAMSLYNN